MILFFLLSQEKLAIYKNREVILLIESNGPIQQIVEKPHEIWAFLTILHRRDIVRIKCTILDELLVVSGTWFFERLTIHGKFHPQQIKSRSQHRNSLQWYWIIKVLQILSLNLLFQHANCVALLLNRQYWIWIFATKVIWKRQLSRVESYSEIAQSERHFSVFRPVCWWPAHIWVELAVANIGWRPCVERASQNTWIRAFILSSQNVQGKDMPPEPSTHFCFKRRNVWLIAVAIYVHLNCYSDCHANKAVDVGPLRI